MCAHSTESRRRPPSPAAVRRLILADHAKLRRAVDELEARHRAAPVEGSEVLRAAFSALLGNLEQHIERENRMLAPALRESDAWGPVRAEAFARHHEAQHRELEAMHAIATDGDARTLADRVRRFINELRVEMDQEERDLLDPDVLRNDVVAIDPEAG